jgi:hypothetical protein
MLAGSHLPRLRRAVALGACASLVTLTAGCAREAASSSPPPASRSTPRALPAPAMAAEASAPIVEVVYDGALGEGWQDYGWAPRELGPGPARLDLSRYGGWIIAHPGLTGRYGALVLRVAAPPAHGDFLEVRVDSDRQSVFPRIIVRDEHRRALPDGWSEIVIPLRVLDPDELPFDRVVLRAARAVGSARVRVDKIGFTAAGPRAPRPALPAEEVDLTIDCAGEATPVSPLIYGIAYDPRLDARDQHQWKLGASARRWGGNPASRYNWELGAAWNTASDWFFENVDYTGAPGFTYADFLRADLDHHVQTALTVPLLGWVARDTRSNGFPVSELGPQRAVDPYRTDAGDGVGRDGKPLAPGPPTRTSVASSPESIQRWVEQIRAEDRRRGARSVQMYILDNEPMLWNSTHRDVHPEPVTYDELLDRTIRYASAIRAADPEAVIAGPALWGWPAYFFSAKDAAVGFLLRPDRLAHGNVPLLAWYLQRLREHEQKTGVRLLDVVDVHFYPQAERVGGKEGGIDAATAALRLRSTRALWDPGYRDESWIADRVELIPRMKRLIAENYPGRGLSIGEYNFGAEEHISGGLALAEALGRFGQAGLGSAFYWTYPPDRSPAFWAFRAFRDFDGAGARFLDLSLPSAGAEGVSLFASRDARGAHLVAVLLNLRPDRAIKPQVRLTGCGPVASQRALRYAGGPDGFTAAAVETADGGITTEALPPSSITVLDLHLEVKP